MNVLLIKIFACIALMGLVNSTVIEPAICFSHDEAASQQQESSHCCVVCHAGHHQSLLPTHIQINLLNSNPSGWVETVDAALLNPPLRSIFHPPLSSSLLIR
jgi:hypothetical protein